MIASLLQDQIHKMELAVAAALDEKKEAEVMLARKKADSDRLRDGLASECNIVCTNWLPFSMCV